MSQNQACRECQTGHAQVEMCEPAFWCSTHGIQRHPVVSQDTFLILKATADELLTRLQRAERGLGLYKQATTNAKAVFAHVTECSSCFDPAGFCSLFAALCDTFAGSLETAVIFEQQQSSEVKL